MQFIVVERRQGVGGLEALLKWLKKALLLVLSNQEVMLLMPCKISGIGPLSFLSFPMLMNKLKFGNLHTTLRIP